MGLVVRIYLWLIEQRRKEKSGKPLKIVITLVLINQVLSIETLIFSKTE